MKTNETMIRYEGISYKVLPERLRGGMKRYIENGIKPGDFLQAVICNKLTESFARADFTNSVRMYDIVEFLHDEAPSSCWGSKEIMNNWIKKGGLNAKSNQSDAGASEQLSKQEIAGEGN